MQAFVLWSSGKLEPAVVKLRAEPHPKALTQLLPAYAPHLRSLTHRHCGGGGQAHRHVAQAPPSPNSTLLAMVTTLSFCVINLTLQPQRLRSNEPSKSATQRLPRVANARKRVGA